MYHINTETKKGCQLIISRHSFSIFKLKWPFIDKNGDSVEGGCTIDVPIETGKMPVTELGEGSLIDIVSAMIGEGNDIPEYKNYFDAGRLDSIMNDWFNAKEHLSPAFGV